MSLACPIRARVTSPKHSVGRGYKVLYREAHELIEEIHEARKLDELHKHRAQLKAAELVVIGDLFLRKLPSSAGDGLADVLMSRYKNARRPSHRTNPWTTGRSCSATSSSSHRCSIDLCIMRICLSSRARVDGSQKPPRELRRALTACNHHLGPVTSGGGI